MDTRQVRCITILQREHILLQVEDTVLRQKLPVKDGTQNNQTDTQRQATQHDCLPACWAMGTDKMKKFGVRKIIFCPIG
jgi:hypothetical protein